MTTSAIRLRLHEGDLPEGLLGGQRALAVDTETTGLEILGRDRLCLVQISDGSGECHLVRFKRGANRAPRLKTLLEDESRLKIFHYARFDWSVLFSALAAETAPLYCTKIASKLARGYSEAHGLKDLCRELLGVEISKKQQSSDWGREKLSDAQQHYAALDVAYLHKLKAILDAMLEREGRMALAQACFDFIPTRARLDLEGWKAQDIFAH